MKEDIRRIQKESEIFLSCLIFKAYSETLSDLCENVKVNSFTISMIISSIFRLGDLETVLIILIMERSNWKEPSTVDDMFFGKRKFGEIYQKLSGDEGDSINKFVFFQLMFIALFAKVE